VSEGWVYRGLKTAAWEHDDGLLPRVVLDQIPALAPAGDVNEKVKQLLWSVAKTKRISLLECETMIDHVHLLLETASKDTLAEDIKLLKGRSSYELFRALPELKSDAHVLALWQRSFNARQIPTSQVDIVRRYIQTQDQRLEAYER